jgi:hypothetical protein
MLTKLIAIVMLPLSILILLQETNLYVIELSFDLMVLSASLMILLQILVLVMVKVHQENLTIINWLTAIVFVLPAVYYFLQQFLTPVPQMPLILGAMMLAESVYALH